jgi:hypothetical protein
MAHSMSPCAACHVLIDPVGLTFEHYDGLGRYRTTENNQPIDATGSVELDGVQRPVIDAIDLVGKLVSSQQVRECVARQWLRYALRRMESNQEEGTLRLLSVETARNDDLRSLLVTLAQSNAFRYRGLVAGEP